MAEIPSEIASSAAQAGFKAQQVGAEREARRAAQATAADRQLKAVDEAAATVDTDDADTEVFTDAEEGGGSQGRTDQNEEEAADEDSSAKPKPGGITRDDDGRLHVDLEA